MGKVANSARDLLNKENGIFLGKWGLPCLYLCLRIRYHETGSAVPSRVSLLIETEYVTYSFFRFPRRCPFIHSFLSMPSTAIRLVSSLPRHTIIALGKREKATSQKKKRQTVVRYCT